MEQHGREFNSAKMNEVRLLPDAGTCRREDQRQDRAILLWPIWMLHPAQEIRFCQSRDGSRIAYATCGAGPPLVWIGHWVRHLNYDWKNPVWRPWLRFLTSRFNVLDSIGAVAASQIAKASLSLQRHVEGLEAVVESAGFKQFFCWQALRVP